MKLFHLDTSVPTHVGYQHQVKEANIKRIFDLVREDKCRSRAELVRSMHLSATSVSVLVDDLTRRGLISETGPTQTSLPGRRPISLRLNSDAGQLAVFTISHEGIRYTLLNLHCEPIERYFTPMSCSDFTPEDVPARLNSQFDEILLKRSKRFDRSRALMVGICSPGVYNERKRAIQTSASLGYSLPEDMLLDFQKRVGLPFYLSNDTVSLAYAEKKYLDAIGPEQRNMVFVKVHHDIRASGIINGNLYRNPDNISGEIGHCTIDYNGRPCRCGSRGCLERYVNLDAILEDARQAALEAGIDAPKSLEELARRYPNEYALLASVRHSAELLAYGLYNLTCCGGIRRIVLGGGIEALGEPFLTALRDSLSQRALLEDSLIITYAQAGPDAPGIGLAKHYLDKVYTITM